MAPATSHDGTVTTEELLTIYKSPKMKKLVSKTHLLSSVDLQTLNTTAEQVSFYCNIVNFLYAHCLMVCVAGEQGGSETADRILQQSMVSLTELQRSPVLQAGLFSQLGYHIGQLGLISCHDLHYSILRRGLSATRIAKSIPLHCRLGGYTLFSNVEPPIYTSITFIQPPQSQTPGLNFPPRHQTPEYCL